MAETQTEYFLESSQSQSRPVHILKMISTLPLTPYTSILTMERVHTVTPVLPEGRPLRVTLTGALPSGSGHSGDGHSVVPALALLASCNNNNLVRSVGMSVCLMVRLVLSGWVRLVRNLDLETPVNMQQTRNIHQPAFDTSPDWASRVVGGERIAQHLDTTGQRESSIFLSNYYLP